MDFLLGLLRWADGLGYAGGIAFVVIYIIATVAFIPGSLLTLGAGVIFGVVWGSLYVFLGATLGAIAAFAVGRYALRDWVSRQIADNPKFTAIDRAIAASGFKIVLLTRLSPIFPFNLLNYALGITSVKFHDYAIASIGMLPATVLYVYIGSLAGDLARLSEVPASDQTLQWGFRLFGLAATIAVTVYVTHIAQKSLAELD